MRKRYQEATAITFGLEDSQKSIDEIFVTHAYGVKAGQIVDHVDIMPLWTVMPLLSAFEEQEIKKLDKKRRKR